MKIQVLNVAADDYANFSHDNANALRSVGVKCVDVKYLPHVFKYDSESEIVNNQKLKELIKAAEIVQIMHSNDNALTICKQLKKKRVIVYHTGTRYRQDPALYNAIFNNNVERSIIALGEFSGLGSKNETYLVGAINTDKIQPLNYYNNNILVDVLHLPSNPVVKGSDTINKMVKEIKQQRDFSYYTSNDRREYDKQLEMMSWCDIYLELFAPTQGGKPYGSWGITALEAAALGKIVFTNHASRKVYATVYGNYPALEAWDNYEIFRDRLFYYIQNPDLIRQQQITTRNWVVDNHSYTATGNRLKTILGL